MKTTPRILIVEDEPAIAELLIINLKHNGFAPVWSGDGMAAQRELDALLQMPFCLIGCCLDKVA